MKRITRFIAFFLCLLVLIDSLIVSVMAANWDNNESASIISSVKWNSKIATGFGGGSGSESDPYLITDGTELAYLSNCVKNGNRFDKKYFLQTNDIDLCDLLWTPIGTASSNFGGYYNGADHSVFNLNINGGNYCGLFGVCSSSSNVISDLKIVNATVHGQNYVGAIAGHVKNGTVSNCKIESVTVFGSENVGGMIGNGNIIQNCNSILTQVQGTNNVGGVAGTAGRAYSCYSSSVSVNGVNNIGGIFGRCPEVNNCVNFGFLTKENQEYNVTGNECVGGVVGDSSLTVSQCINYADVQGKTKVGGVLGGCFAYGIVTESYSSGNISGDSFVGGVVGGPGPGGIVTDCYNTGNVSGSNKETTGGVLGNAWQNSPKILRNYNYGSVNIGGHVYGTDGLYGFISFEASGNYYLSDNTSVSYDGSVFAKNEVAYPLTVYDFMSQSCFRGWDFNNIWIMSEKDGRPVLRNASINMDAICRIVVMDGTTGKVIENASVSQIIVRDGDTGKPVRDELASYLITGENGIFNISNMLKSFSYDYEIVITADDYEDFMCYLSDLDISTGKNIATNIAPMWKTGDKSPNVIEQGEHEVFIKTTYDAFVDDNGFVKKYWNGINESTVIASGVWEVLGDIKDIISLDPFAWNDLLIFQDYYDAFIVEYLLSISGNKSFEQLCKEDFSTQFPTDESTKKYYNAYKLCKDDLKDKIVNNIVEVINDPELSEKEWEAIFDGKYDNKFVDILKEKIAAPDTLKNDLKSILDNPVELTEEELVVYNDLLKWAVTNEKSANQIFNEISSETIIPVLTGYKQAKDAVNDIISCCSIAKVCVDANKDVFKILYETHDELKKTNPKYAKWFIKNIDKYYEIATDTAALTRFLFNNSLLSITEGTWNIVFQKTFTEWVYSTIATKFSITIPQMKAVVAVYTATYSILNSLTKLGDMDKLILLMNYVAPLESAMENVVRDHGVAFLADGSLKKMDEYCFAYGCLKQLNLYLYEAAQDVTQLIKNTSIDKSEADTKLKELTRLKLAWEDSSCHSNILNNRYKYCIHITEQPNSIHYVSDSTSYASIKAVGNNLSYQWEYCLDNGLNWYEFTGKTATSCLMKPIDGVKTYSFRCQVTNPYGVTVYSDMATLQCTEGSNDPGKWEPATELTPELSGGNINLGFTTTASAYKDELEYTAGDKLNFVICDGNTVIGISEVAVLNAKTEVKFSVNPAEITIGFTAKLVNETKKETKEIATVSMADYCHTMIEQSADPKLVTLCKSILDYGCAAQDLFLGEHEKDDEANLSDLPKNANVPDDTVLTEDNFPKIKADMSFFALENATVRLYFDTVLAHDSFSISDPNKIGTVVFGKVDAIEDTEKYDYVEIQNIKPSDLGKTFTVKLNGVSYEYSALQCVYDIAAACEGMEFNAAKVLYPSLENYYLAASAYFSN